MNDSKVLLLIGFVLGIFLLFVSVNASIGVTTATTTTEKPREEIYHRLIDNSTSKPNVNHTVSPLAEISETELERLCPSGELEVLKSVPHGKPCTHGDHEFWHLTCRCHYISELPCPKCPEASTTTIPTTQAPPTFPSGVNWPYFVMSVPQHNYSVLYQIPSGDPSEKNTTYPNNKFNIYNSAGGVVSLYFYQMGNNYNSHTKEGTDTKPPTGPTTATPVATPKLVKG